jgi:hypothetical protein
VGTTRLSEPWDQVFHLTDPDLRPGDSWRFMAMKSTVGYGDETWILWGFSSHPQG